MSEIRAGTINDIDEDLTGAEKKKLDVYFPEIDGKYRAICLYNGVNYPKCENNENNLCLAEYDERPRHLYHRWDGKNAIKCLCG